MAVIDINDTPALLSSARTILTHLLLLIFYSFAIECASSRQFYSRISTDRGCGSTVAAAGGPEARPRSHQTQGRHQRMDRQVQQGRTSNSQDPKLHQLPGKPTRHSRWTGWSPG